MNKLKNKKIIIVLTVAILAGIIASVLIFSFLSPTRTTMFVFNGNYEAGTKISGSMLTPVQADSRIIVAGSSTGAGTHFITVDNYTQMVSENDVLKVDVSKGDCFMVSMLSSKASNRIALNMNPTSIAVTIPVNNTTGVSSSVKAESHVNVYGTYNSGGTYLLLENVRILSVEKSDGKLTGFTLELTNQEAVKVIDATTTGSIYCGLTNDEGYIYELNKNVIPSESVPAS